MNATEKRARLEELKASMDSKHLAVCGHILAGKTQAEAWMAEYKRVKKKETAEANCARMLSSAKSGAREFIDLTRELATASAAEKLGIDEERVLREMALLAFANVQDLYDEQGNLIPICDLPRDVAAAIQSVKARRVMSREDDEDTTIIEVKGYDKRATLVDLGKHIGMFKEKVEVNAADPLTDILERIAANRRERGPLPSGE